MPRCGLERRRKSWRSPLERPESGCDPAWPRGELGVAAVAVAEDDLAPRRPSALDVLPVPGTIGVPMTETEHLRGEPRELAERGSDEDRSRSGKGRHPYRRLPRELTEEELATSGVQKLILHENDQLWEQNYELQGFRDRFHETDKEVAVLRERHKEAAAQDIVLGATLAIGALIIGFVPSLWAPIEEAPTGLIALVVGAVLVLGSVGARLSWRRPFSRLEKER